jgi:hypothetical protein
MMSSITYTYRPSRAPLGLILTALLVCLTAGVLMLYGRSERRPLPKPYPMPKPGFIDTSQSHAFEQHSFEEVMRAYRCYDSKDMVDGIFKHEHPNFNWVWIILCKDTDGRWYARVVYLVKGAVTERTAFMIKNGAKDWEVIGKWLLNKVINEGGQMVTRANQLPWK